ncbi:MAG: TrkH family potassium uptake protein [Muribaculaceae bacterium]|nr:TrkH family potassium uptake protein [Muribaculaceae bacterium]
MRKITRQPLFNFPMLLKIVGMLLLIECAFLLIPLVTGLIYHERDAFTIGATALGTCLAGLLLSRGIRPTHTRLSKRDGFLLTSFVWVAFSLFGMLPFIFSKSTPCTVTDAFFEAMSGFTTTGASTLGNRPEMSNCLLMWRAVMQWIGGLGIILFTLAVIPMLNTRGGMQMFNAEMTGITHDKIRPRISQTAKSLWGVYAILTIMLTLLLYLGPMSFFDALCTAFGTVSTGGYTSGIAGIEAMQHAYVKAVMTVFMFLGGVNFALIFRLITGQPKQLIRNDVFRIYIKFIGVMWMCFAIAGLVSDGYNGPVRLLLDPLFQVVAISTSTGISLLPVAGWGGFTLILTMVMMFFGGCAGSTSGGAKIDRMVYLFKNIRNELYRCIYPNAVLPVQVGGRVASPQLVGKVVAFLCIYVLVVLIGAAILTIMNVPFVDAFFSCFSCICNTGFGTDITGLGESYDMLPFAAKWVLSLIMLIGRLEVFSVLVLLLPSFWRRG